MGRKLATMGIILTAGFALFGVVAASGESEPKEFHTESSSAIVTGEQLSTYGFELYDSGNVEIRCKGANFQAAESGKTFGELTISPILGECSAGPIHPTDVNFEGCDYRFALEEGTEETKDKSTHSQGSFQIACPAGKKINFTVTNMLGLPVCRITVPAQTPTQNTMDFKNMGSGTTRDIRTTFTVGGLHSEVHGGHGTCGEKATTTHSVVTGEITLKAYEGEWPNTGSQVGLWVE